VEIAADLTIAGWSQVLRGEFLEIPNLRLTRTQVEQLWGLDGATCDAVIIALMGAGFLEQTQAGAYIRANVRADSARPPARWIENPASRRVTEPPIES
jgi:hypothetical protein